MALDLLVLTAAGGKGKRSVIRFSLLALKFQVWTCALRAVQTRVPGWGGPQSFIVAGVEPIILSSSYFR